MPPALVLWLALAQLPSPYAGITWSPPLSGSLEPALYARLGARAMDKPVDKPAPKVGLDSTDFKPVQPRSVPQALVSGSKALTRLQGRALVEGLEEGLNSFERMSRKNNVASALAFFIAVSLQTLGEKEVGDDELQRMTEAINDELAASVAYRKMSPKQKQLLYETCVVVGSLIGGMAAWGNSTGEPAVMGQAKQLALSALSTFKAPLSPRRGEGRP